MIDVSQWRATIGLWACHQISYSSGPNKDISSTDSSGSSINGFTVVRRIRDLTFSLALFFLLLIIISGDVELNPGPKTGKISNLCACMIITSTDHNSSILVSCIIVPFSTLNMKHAREPYHCFEPQHMQYLFSRNFA